MTTGVSPVMRVVLPLGVLGLGVAIFVLFIQTRPVPEKKPRVDQGTLVEVVRVDKKPAKPEVRAQGSIVPARRVVLQSEVTGRVIWQSEALLPGGRFDKGQPLLRIDPADYVLKAKQSQAQVDQAEVALQLEKSRKEIAKREWEIIGEEQMATEEGKAVALREPQLKGAKVALDAAESAKRQAALAISRTRIEAPFNGFVQEESVDVGQLVAPGTPLATLIGTDAFWVQVSVPPEALRFILVPGLNATEEQASRARVWQEVGGERVEKQGHVIRLLGDLDPVGRMARLLVQIDDPMDLAKARAGNREKDAAVKPKNELPVLLGAFVHVEIESRSLGDVFEVPRVALREQDQVYLFDQGRLAIRKVGLVWKGEDSVLVNSGLTAGDLVIVTSLPGAVEGMKLRRQGMQKQKALGRR